LNHEEHEEHEEVEQGLGPGLGASESANESGIVAHRCDARFRFQEGMRRAVEISAISIRLVFLRVLRVLRGSIFAFV